MRLLLTGSPGSSYAQLIAVLIVFVLVLGITAATTKWIANYQKQQSTGANIQVIETSRISNNKYVQIVRVGETYMVIAVCKDTVTLLGQVPEEQLKISGNVQSFRFKELLDKAVGRQSRAAEEPGESRDHDEHEA
ncbi:MAG: flagellar biosynthetic protein FliO [Acetatifactor sp.]|nr:flagellar biosynthetic protein FliO [Acetatifactor sp.]